MARHPLIEPRDGRLPPGTRRGVGLLVDVDEDAVGVGAAFAAVEVEGWERTADTAAVHSWIERDANLWPAVASQALAGGWADPAVRTEWGDGGWLVARVSAVAGGGSRIDIRGELDEPVEARLAEALEGLGARLVRRWVPTAAAAPGRAPIPAAMRPKPRARRRADGGEG